LFSGAARHADHAPSRLRAADGICGIPGTENAIRFWSSFTIHGGGFVFGSPDTTCAMLGGIAHATWRAAVLPYYRLAPKQHPPPRSKMSPRP